MTNVDKVLCIINRLLHDLESGDLLESIFESVKVLLVNLC